MILGNQGELTFDHVIPRSSGGTTRWDNVVAACSPCNLRKGSKSLGRRLHLRRNRDNQLLLSYNLGRKFPPITFTTVGWIFYIGIAN